jgi:hypothetical protein
LPTIVAGHVHGRGPESRRSSSRKSACLHSTGQQDTFELRLRRLWSPCEKRRLKAFGIGHRTGAYSREYEYSVRGEVGVTWPIAPLVDLWAGPKGESLYRSCNPSVFRATHLTADLSPSPTYCVLFCSIPPASPKPNPASSKPLGDLLYTAMSPTLRPGKPM